MRESTHIAIAAPSTQAASRYTRLNKWEYLVPALAAASLLTSCVMISSKKYFWNDELYSYYFTSDPSLWKMLVAFHDQINNTPLLYFLLGWLWDKLFTSSELSLRLFSSVAMCLALFMVWSTLRRSFPFWATSIGSLGVFCTSQIILSQNAEARMYGLFLALSAAGLWLYDRLNRSQKPANRLLLANMCLHIGLLHTHLFGGFYSGAILLAFLLTDLCFKLWRPKVYLSILLSWLSVILYLPSFLNQSDAGKPRTWIPTPLFSDLIEFFDSSYLYKPSVFLILLLIAGIQLLVNKTGEQTAGQPNTRLSNSKQDFFAEKTEFALLIFAALFVMVPVPVWLISVTLKPIFWDRYLIPSALGFAILLTFVASRLLTLPTSFHSSELKYKTTSVYAFIINCILLLITTLNLVAYPIKDAKRQGLEIRPGQFDYAFGYEDLPVVVQGSNAFVQRLYYSSTPERYHYILDWPSAVNEHSGLFGPQEYKHLAALKRNYPLRFHNVVNSQEFLDKYDRFLVIDYLNYERECPLEVMGIDTDWKDIHCPQWVETYFLNNPMYKVSCIGIDANYYTSSC